MPDAPDPPDELLAEIDREPGDEPMDVFRWTGGATTKYFLGAAGVGLFGAGLFAMFVWIGLNHVSTAGERFGLIGFGLLLQLLMLWSAWRWVQRYRGTAVRVHLYESGLLWFSPGGGWKAGRWADAVAFYRHETRSDGEEASNCRVEFADGRAVTFAAQMRDYQNLAAHAQTLMHRALFPVLKARYDAGEAVEFGRIVLTATEFVSKAGGGLLEWRKPLADIREAEVANGCLWLNHRTNRTKGYMSGLAEIPNYTVLFALLPFPLGNWRKDAFDE